MALLEPVIQHVFDAQVWKLITDPLADMLFVETRDAENRLTCFSGFDMKSGNTNFTGMAMEEKWLTGIESCYNGVLFLHGYQSAQSPVHKGIIAVNGHTGETLWSNYTYAIDRVIAAGPVVYNVQLQPRKPLLAYALTGEVLRPFDALIDYDMDEQLLLPDVLNMPDEDIPAHVTGTVTGNVHYMEHNSFRIVSLHTFGDDNLTQLLLILQGGEVVYRDVLNDGIQKLQPEAFIVQRDRLLYIKNKVELKVLNL